MTKLDGITLDDVDICVRLMTWLAEDDASGDLNGPIEARETIAAVGRMLQHHFEYQQEEKAAGSANADGSHDESDDRGFRVGDQHEA